MSSALGRVRSARLQLGLAVVAGAILWGGAAAILLFAAAGVLDVVVGLARSVRGVAVPGMFAAFALAAGAALWRGRAVLSLDSVALWIEERVPSLGYALVTAVGMRGLGVHGGLEHTVAAHEWERELARSAARAIARPLIPLLIGMIVLAALPGGTVERVATPRPGDSIARTPLSAAEERSLLTPLNATVHPPAYTGQVAYAVDEPFTIEALAGSRIEVRGRGDASRVEAGAGGRLIGAAREGDRWRIDLAMPDQAAAVRLTDGVHHRLLALVPLTDEPPAVRLSHPVRDTVLRTPTGQVILEAQARDDYGLVRAAFEYIISSGQGELFRFRSGTAGEVFPAGSRQSMLRASISLDSLELSPGDIVHLRAVAWDANDVSGPGMGVSETRAIRVARAGEYDTVAVEGAPPPDLDADAVSQRMLIILTERLENRRRQMARDSFVAESRALAQRQNMLRRRVAEIVFMRLGMQPDAEHSHGPGDGHDHSDEELAGFLTPERLVEETGTAVSAQGLAAVGGHGHDESPILAINRPLLDAYNHMWEAGGELAIGEPARALPPMRRALEALQKAREAERYYARGRSPRLVVDVARVRLAARENVSPSARAHSRLSEPPRLRLSARLLAAVELLGSKPDAAIDSLLILRLDALSDVPEAAAPLARAMEALRTGRDATDALIEARRVIEGTARPASGAVPWRGGW